MNVRAFVLTLALLASVLVAPPPFPYAPTHAAAAGDAPFVEVKGHAFSPARLVVLVQTKVTWINNDTEVHGVTSDPDQADSFDKTPPMGPAPLEGTGLNHQVVTFNKLGVIAYHCNQHADMHGVIEVVSSLAGPTVTLSVEDDKFNPEFANVNAGQKVKWQNAGQHLHSVVFEDSMIGKLGDVPVGGNISKNLTDGSYRYRCEYHSTGFETGMVGKLHVGNATPAFPPKIAFTAPVAGSTVNGKVAVTGTATLGSTGSPGVTGVEVRVGSGTFQPATLSGSGDSRTWLWEWDTLGATPGPVTLTAHSLAGTLKSDDSTVDVTVTAAPSTSGAADNTAAKDGKKGGAPGFEIGLALAALMLIVVAVRRRED